MPGDNVTITVKLIAPIAMEEGLRFAIREGGRTVGAGVVAKIEKRTDMYISTLRSHIEAMGGQLEVVARFPDGAVKISNFSDLGSSAVA